MTRPLALALLLGPALGAGDPPVQQGEENVLVTYDLRAVMPRWDASEEWGQTLLTPPAVEPFDGDLPTIEDTLGYADLTSLELLDLLNQSLGDELRREGRELVVEGNVLSVMAPQSLQEQVRSILDGLQTALAGTVPMRVEVLTLGEGGTTEMVPSPVLSEDEAAKLVTALVGRGAQHRGYQLELSAGRTAQLDAFRRIPFLFDFDVEIAQSMSVYAPVMAETMDGARIALRGLPVAGGLALSALVMRSELLGKIEKRPLVLRGVISRAEGGPSEIQNGPDGIQSPEVLEHGVAFDTFLPDGKALALTFESTLGAKTTRQVVLLRRMGGTMTSYLVRPIPRTNRTLIALNGDLFRTPRFDIEAYLSRLDQSHAPHPNLVAKVDGAPSNFLLEWTKVRFSVWRRFGPWILIVTDPSWDRDGAAQLDRLVKAQRPSNTLLGVSVDLRAQGREASFPVRLRLPMLEGSNAGLVVGRAWTAVTGFDVEVAQGASVPDPVVSSLFDGLALALSIQGSLCETKGVAMLYDYPVVALDPGYPLLGPLDRPEPRLLRFDERLRMPEGQPARARIGGASERADQPGLAVEIAVSALR